MPIAPETRLVAAPDILAAMTGDVLVLMDPDGGHYYTFEGAGPDIWAEIEAPVSVAELIGRLTEAFEAPEDEIRRSTLVFLESLLEKRLITLL